MFKEKGQTLVWVAGLALLAALAVILLITLIPNTKPAMEVIVDSIDSLSSANQSAAPVFQLNGATYKLSDSIVFSEGWNSEDGEFHIKQGPFEIKLTNSVEENGNCSLTGQLWIGGAHSSHKDNQQGDCDFLTMLNFFDDLVKKFKNSHQELFQENGQWLDTIKDVLSLWLKTAG